jgi:serine protease AprX
MKKILLLVCVAIAISVSSYAQLTRYIIYLKDKGNNTFSISNPSAYLSQRAVDRRTKYNIPIDSLDLPVTASYVTQIRNVPNVTILNVSKWLNAVSVRITNASAVTTITALPFVKSISAFASRAVSNDEPPVTKDKFEEERKFSLIPPDQQRGNNTNADVYNYGTTALAEMVLHKANFLHNIGLNGTGLRIAAMDGGFFNYNNANYNAFDSVNINGGILDTWDFVDRHPSVSEDDSHGMSCVSTILANIPGQFVGKAPKASFYLYRTEDVFSEYPIEEHNWACGAERADSAGAEIITSSLGYTTFDDASLNHVYARDMNGNTTMAAIAGDIAAKKGMLVFVSAGNDGAGSWRFISTASDGDSVMCIGSVSNLGSVASTSSYGPSADGQVKPDMSSVGANAIVQTGGGNIGTSNGTSFACPNMAGLATCLWQGFPEYNNMKIANALRQAGSRATNPDDRMGFGIPDMKKAFGILLSEFSTANGSSAGCAATINWNSKDANIMKYEIERKLPTETNYTKVAEKPAIGGAVLSIQNYSFNENVPPGTNGNVTYRLRQIIDTTAATFTGVYIDSVTLAVSACTATGIDPLNPATEKVVIIPNPVAASEFNLKIETPYAINNISIRIIDMKGRVMQVFQRSKGTGVITFPLPLSRLAKGQYTLAVYNGQKILATRELIKL